MYVRRRISNNCLYNQKGDEYCSIRGNIIFYDTLSRVHYRAKRTMYRCSSDSSRAMSVRI